MYNIIKFNPNIHPYQFTAIYYDSIGKYEYLALVDRSEKIYCSGDGITWEEFPLLLPFINNWKHLVITKSHIIVYNRGESSFYYYCINRIVDDKSLSKLLQKQWKRYDISKDFEKITKLISIVADDSGKIVVYGADDNENNYSISLYDILDTINETVFNYKCSKILDNRVAFTTDIHNINTLTQYNEILLSVYNKAEPPDTSLVYLETYDGNTFGQYDIENVIYQSIGGHTLDIDMRKRKPKIYINGFYVEVNDFNDPARYAGHENVKGLFISRKINTKEKSSELLYIEEYYRLRDRYSDVYRIEDLIVVKVYAVSDRDNNRMIIYDTRNTEHGLVNKIAEIQSIDKDILELKFTYNRKLNMLLGITKDRNELVKITLD